MTLGMQSRTLVPVSSHAWKVESATSISYLSSEESQLLNAIKVGAEQSDVAKKRVISALCRKSSTVSEIANILRLNEKAVYAYLLQLCDTRSVCRFFTYLDVSDRNQEFIANFSTFEFEQPLSTGSYQFRSVPLSTSTEESIFISLIAYEKYRILIPKISDKAIKMLEETWKKLVPVEWRKAVILELCLCTPMGVKRLATIFDRGAPAIALSVRELRIHKPPFLAVCYPELTLSNELQEFKTINYEQYTPPCTDDIMARGCAGQKQEVSQTTTTEGIHPR